MALYTIKDFINKINEQSINTVINNILLNIQEEKQRNIFISSTKDIANNQILNNQQNSKQQLLKNIAYSLKDNVCTVNHLTTGGCKILDKFIPDYSAHIYEKLTNAGAILVGKNNLDELGMGGTGLSTFYGEVSNPWDFQRIPGGSSSGSTVTVALGIVPFSIGTDTGDSVRRPACYCGIHGFKPTWNRISKYGIIPYTPSLDTAGVLANCVEDIAKVYEVISGPDSKDATCSSLPEDKVFTEKRYMQSLKGKKVLVIKEIDDELKKHQEYYLSFYKYLNYLKQADIKIEVKEFGIDLLKSLLPTYNMISYAESTSCQSYLQGIIINNASNKKANNYQTWEEVILDTRKKFTTLTKLRQIFGAYFLLEDNRDKYFEQSKRIRRLLCNKLKNLFKEYDIIISPVAEIAPFKKDVRIKSFATSPFDLLTDHLLIANFYGSPSYALPIDIVNKMPYGILLTTDQFKEDVCLAFANYLEKYTDWSNKREKLKAYVQNK